MARKLQNRVGKESVLQDHAYMDYLLLTEVISPKQTRPFLDAVVFPLSHNEYANCESLRLQKKKKKQPQNKKTPDCLFLPSALTAAPSPLNSTTKADYIDRYFS